MGTMFLEQMKRPAGSDLVAEEVTNLMICAMMRIGPLTWWTGVFFGYEDVVTGAAVRADDVKVRSVGVARGYHVAFVVDNAVVGVGSDIVEELGDVVIGEFGGRGLSGANLTESSK